MNTYLIVCMPIINDSNFEVLIFKEKDYIPFSDYIN